VTKVDKPNSFRNGPDERGHFGIFGGRFVALAEVGFDFHDAPAKPFIFKDTAEQAASYLNGWRRVEFTVQRLKSHLALP